MDLRLYWKEKICPSYIKYKKWPSGSVILQISTKGWERMKFGLLLSLLFKRLQWCQSTRKKSKFLTGEHRCLHDQTPASLHLWPCLQSISPAAWFLCLLVIAAIVAVALNCFPSKLLFIFWVSAQRAASLPQTDWPDPFLWPCSIW